jgi:hypothetical protein
MRVGAAIGTYIVAVEQELHAGRISLRAARVAHALASLVLAYGRREDYIGVRQLRKRAHVRTQDVIPLAHELAEAGLLRLRVGGCTRRTHFRLPLYGRTNVSEGNAGHPSTVSSAETEAVTARETHRLSYGERRGVHAKKRVRSLSKPCPECEVGGGRHLVDCSRAGTTNHAAGDAAERR